MTTSLRLLFLLAVLALGAGLVAMRAENAELAAKVSQGGAP